MLSVIQLLSTLFWHQVTFCLLPRLSLPLLLHLHLFSLSTLLSLLLTALRQALRVIFFLSSFSVPAFCSYLSFFFSHVCFISSLLFSFNTSLLLSSGFPRVFLSTSPASASSLLCFQLSFYLAPLRLRVIASSPLLLYKVNVSKYGLPAFFYFILTQIFLSIIFY